MSDDPVTALPDWSPARHARMSRVTSTRLPVVDQQGGPLGLLTRDQVLGAVVLAPEPGSLS